MSKLQKIVKRKTWICVLTAFEKKEFEFRIVTALNCKIEKSLLTVF